MREVDIGKIMALKEAGWRIGEIAAEMHMGQDEVEREISSYMEKEKENPMDSQSPGNGGDGKGMPMVVLPLDKFEEIWKESAAIGAKEALKAFRQEQEKEYGRKADRRLRNTKLLLRNYHMLKEHAENSVFGRTQIGESAIDILESMMSLYDDEVIIESIKRSATRTAVIVSHIETMFGLYHAYCDKSSNREIEIRRYESLWDMYMAQNSLSVKEIADKQRVSKDTIYADLKAALERVSALIFGVDGLGVH